MRETTETRVRETTAAETSHTIFVLEYVLTDATPATRRELEALCRNCSYSTRRVYRLFTD